MKNFVLLILLTVLASSCNPSRETKENIIGIIPQPQKIVAGEGRIELSKPVTLVANTDEEKSAAWFLKEYLNLKDIECNIVDKKIDDHTITFTVTTDTLSGKEGYQLKASETGVTIAASAGTGLFYGTQTLIQLMAENENAIPYVSIEDQPRFAYRGLHLDVGRNMFSPEFIKRYIALMAHYKFNTFHWHLTEDQGWRIEIKKYPKLTTVGAFRKESPIGRATTKTRASVKYDGKPYGGFYTQEEIKDIVAYAQQHHVTIIPEIEMPGHAQAALASYPYLGCTGGPYEVATTWGVFDDVYCAGKETTFEFLEDVLDEVIELFPGTYIHIGGDECPKTKWEKCPLCQKRIKTEKLANEHELQSYFVQRMEKYLNSKGRSIIGWDEILEGGLAPNSTVMSWRGEEGGIAAAQQKHNVIMSPTQYCYLDYYQADPETEPITAGGLVTVEKIYSYEPIPEQLTPEESKFILGVQGNVWSEYLTTPEHAEYMVFPRAIALAEVAWSAKEKKNYIDFLSRLNDNRSLLDSWKVNYAKHVFESAKADSVVKD